MNVNETHQELMEETVMNKWEECTGAEVEDSAPDAPMGSLPPGPSILGHSDEAAYNHKPHSKGRSGNEWPCP